MRSPSELKDQYRSDPMEALLLTEEEIGEAKEIIYSFIKGFVKKGVIGLSGGIDSSLVAYLSAEAIGPENIYGLIMPSDSNTVEDEIYAKGVALDLGIKYDVINITPVAESFSKSSEYFNDRLSVGNLKARIRMCYLYGYANSNSALVIGTDNKTEGEIGYFTKYGDGGTDINPIGDLYKTQVRQVAKDIGVPEIIINRAPTAGLWDGQTDEDELGIIYELLDKILLGRDLGYTKMTVANVLEIDLEKVEEIERMRSSTYHKRSMPPSPEVFGGGEEA